MEQARKKITYSIIRYSPSELKGEVVNVGLLFHDFAEKQVKIFMLDEYSNKLKALLENQTEMNMYKTDREILEYYLDKSKEDISGVVGDLNIASYYDENFMGQMYEYYKNQKIILSKPNVAFTRNSEALFKTILKKYVGENNVDVEKAATMNAKKYMKKIFKENENLNKRIRPIKDLDDLEVKIDFSFKNGRWNYMQAIPRPVTPNKNTEWFSKVQLLLDSDINNDSRIHLLYKQSDFYEDIATYNLLMYLKGRYSNLDIHNIDKQTEVKNLCNYIETEGQILVEEVS